MANQVIRDYRGALYFEVRPDWFVRSFAWWAAEHVAEGGAPGYRRSLFDHEGDAVVTADYPRPVSSN